MLLKIVLWSQAQRQQPAPVNYSTSTSTINVLKISKIANSRFANNILKQSTAKQRCVMGVGMCLYTQLVQTKNQQCKSAIILQCYHPHLSDFCSRPRLTQPYKSYNISWCCQNLSSLPVSLKPDRKTADKTAR